MTGRKGLTRNGITVAVEHFPYRKKPVLSVYIENENCAYKVASFNNEKTADWFLELMEEMWLSDINVGNIGGELHGQQTS